MMSIQKNDNYKAAVLFGIAAFISVWIISVMCGINWETNDDAEIAFLLSQTANGGTIFQHKLLVIILHFLYSQYPMVNYWLVSNIMSIAGGFAATLYVIRRKNGDLFSLLASIVLLFFVIRYVLPIMNFTRSATIATCGGTMLLLQSQEDDLKKIKNMDLFFGFAISFLGVATRPEAILITAPFFTVVIILAFFVDKDKNKLLSNVSSLLVIAIFVLLNGFLMSDEEKVYYEYNEFRSAIIDYSEKLPKYEDNLFLYKEARLDEKDISLFQNWITEDPAVFSKEAIGIIAEEKTQSYNLGLLAFNTYWALYDTFQYEDAIVIPVVILVLACFAIKNKRTNIFEVFMIIACFGFLYLYLVWTGRVVGRVVFSLLWVVVCCLLLVMDKEISSSSISFLLPISLVIFSITWSALYVNTHETMIVPWKENEADEILEKCVYDVIDSDCENVYIFQMTPTKDVKQLFEGWKAYPKEYCSNLFYLGGWGARCPYNIDRLNSYGISNPMQALYEKDNVYSCDGWKTDAILSFLQRHYDERISFEEAGKIGDFNIIKYSKR